MKNIILTFAFALAVVCSLTAFTGCQIEKETDESFFAFELNEDETAFVVSAAEGVTLPDTVFVPTEHNGLPVTAVKENGFSGKNCYAIKDVVFKAETALDLGANSFENLKNLRTVEFRNANKVVLNANAFAGCDLLKDVDFGDKINTIEVGRYTFKDCSSLTELNFATVGADNGTSLKEFALNGMTGLKKLTVTNLSDFAPSAIGGCDNIEAFDIAGGDYGSVDGNLYLVSATGLELVRYAPAKQAESFTVDGSVTKIQTGAFDNTKYLKIVEFGEAAQSITVEDYAFAGSSVETIKGYNNDTMTTGKYWLGESKIKTIE